MCSRCGKIKPLDEFHLAKKSPDGHHWWCKECVSEYGKNRERNKSSNTKKEEVPSTPSANAVPSIKTASSKELIDEIKGRGIVVLVDPTPRDLITSLANKGYLGTLEYYEKKTLSVANFKSL